MKINLSPRLSACRSFVRPGDKVADIGCDHGYLGISLLLDGRADYVIATDINEMPLKSAVKNAEKFGVREKMSFFLTNGVQGIPKDFNTLVCAGMGADTIISILTAAPWLKSGDYRMILQCQSKTHLLRQFLSDNGWYISKETVIRDGRFLYTVMEVLWSPTCPRHTPGGNYFPPAMLDNPSDLTWEYLQRMIHKLSVSIRGKGAEANPAEILALKELQQMEETK